MKEEILQILGSLVAVTTGLFVLWSAVGAMKSMGAAGRFWAALTAGLVSAAITFVLRLVL